MERAACPRAEAPVGGFIPWLWCLTVLGLLAWHGWKTVYAFGPDDPIQHLIDDRPIVSGRHPLHLYHGHLGALAFRATRRLSCYDPAFDDGYPKTPVFDGGSRPAELWLYLSNNGYDPAAYKIGVAVCCALVPLLVLAACWGAGLDRAGTALATGSVLLVWWSVPGRRILESGDLDAPFAALAVLAHVGLLIRYDRTPTLLVWTGLLLTGCLGWFAHPVLFPLLLPLLLVYYLSIGPRHSLLTWHLTLALSEVAALLLNAFWLIDWLRHWWLRSPLPNNDDMLTHRTFETLWRAPQWGDQADRIVAAILLGSAVLGVAILNQSHRRVAARLLGLGTGGLWLLAMLGIAWDPLGRVGTAELMVPALWFAALPAAHAWRQCYRLAAHVLRSHWRAAAATAAVLGGVALAGRDVVDRIVHQCQEAPRLTLGLSPERQALVEVLTRCTTTQARILWEDRRGGDSSRWTALLPMLTNRYYIGGLVPHGEIEHANAGMHGNMLRGRALALWSDAELEHYCHCYNIGWVVCRSPESLARFRAWKGVVETAQLSDEGPVVFFALAKPTRSFALKGQATVLHMDSLHITLADVVPEDGVVVLSLHYQTGLRATPERVTLERHPDAGDLIPFLRLRLERPAARVTITWHER